MCVYIYIYILISTSTNYTIIYDTKIICSNMISGVRRRPREGEKKEDIVFYALEALFFFILL